MGYDGGMISRGDDRQAVKAALKRSRIVALLGPRQCGKTTLPRAIDRGYAGAQDGIRCDSVGRIAASIVARGAGRRGSRRGG